MTKYLDGKAQPPDVNQIKVWFDGDLFRWDGEGYNSLLKGELSYALATKFLDNPEIPAYEVLLMIRDRNDPLRSPSWLHPQRLGYGVSVDRKKGKVNSIADFIRILKTWELMTYSVHEDGDLVKIEVRMREERVKRETDRQILREYWIDPNQGYGVVKQRRWGLSIGPYEEVDTSYLELPGGQFVAESSKRVHKRYTIDGDIHTVVPTFEVTTKLIEIEIGETQPEVFTLASLGAPTGARVADRVNGRNYLFEVDAATEEEIDDAMLTMAQETIAIREGNDARRKQWIVYGVLGCVAASVLGLAFWRVASRT